MFVSAYVYSQRMGKNWTFFFNVYDVFSSVYIIRNNAECLIEQILTNTREFRYSRCSNSRVYPLLIFENHFCFFLLWHPCNHLLPSRICQFFPPFPPRSIFSIASRSGFQSCSINFVYSQQCVNCFWRVFLGCAFVTYTSKQCAINAIRTMHQSHTMEVSIR